MKANAVNCYILVTRDTDVIAKIGKFDLENSREKKLLGLKIDTKLFFENNVSPLCKKTSHTLHAVANFGVLWKHS